MIMKNLAYFIIAVFMFTSVIGCEAFVRKFTRKPKHQDQREELVLEPEVYKSTMTKEERYRKAFLYWRSWHDEMISSLSWSGGNHKKQVGCATQAIKNLDEMKSLLNSQKQKALEIYVNQVKGLKNLIIQDTEGFDSNRNRLNAERLRRNIIRDFDYEVIKDAML